MIDDVNQTPFPEENRKFLEDQQQSKKEKIVLLIALFSLILSAFSLSWRRNPPVFKVVDIQCLIRQQSQQLVKESVSGKVTPKQVYQAAEDLKEFLDSWAQEHHVFLLAKGTVWGGEGITDVTDQILTDFNKED